MPKALTGGRSSRNGKSHIFAPIVLPGSADDEALKKADYVQEEYLLSGTGNIYAEGLQGGPISVAKSGVPYTTRVVIVRPRDPKNSTASCNSPSSTPALPARNGAGSTRWCCARARPMRW
jgi:hypothetical protein